MCGKTLGESLLVHFEEDINHILTGIRNASIYVYSNNLFHIKIS